MSADDTGHTAGHSVEAHEPETVSESHQETDEVENRGGAGQQTPSGAGAERPVEGTDVTADESSAPRESAAVIRLQAAVRRFLAVRRVRQLAREIYEKAFDDDNSCFFYYNRLTGESRCAFGQARPWPTGRRRCSKFRTGLLSWGEFLSVFCRDASHGVRFNGFATYTSLRCSRRSSGSP